MADDDIRDIETDNDDEAVLDLSLANEHSAFLDDEELHEQLTDEGDNDERTALTAAHQGSRATSTPAAEAVAFNAASDSDLLNASPEYGNSAANAAARSANGLPTGDPANAVQDELGFEAQVPDGDPSNGNGRGAATATERNPGTAGANTIDALQPGGDNSNPASTGPSGPSSATSEEQPLQSDLLTELNSRQTNSDDGLGGSGDQGAQAGGGSENDNQEEYTEDDGGQSDGQEAQGGGGAGGGGVNPIIGDRFDNNLVGTDGRDMINAQDGNDTISAGAGDDLVMGKKGDDWIEGGLGDDTLKGGHGDDTFAFSDADFDGNAWTDTVDGQGTNGKAPASDYDTIDLANVTQGWTLEVDGAGAGVEASSGDNPSQYTNGADFSGTITFDDGSTVVFDNIEKVDW